MYRETRTTRRTHVLVLSVLLLTQVAACSRKTVCFVDVTSSAPIATPIDELRVTLSAAGETRELHYPPVNGATSIMLDNNFVVNVTGLADGVPLEITVVAVGGGADLATGSDTQPVNPGHVVYYSVTLQPLGGTCGDGTANAGEDCDGTDLASNDCMALGFTAGTLACDAGCMFDTSGCTGNPCGNGMLDPAEDCEGTNLGTDDCTTLGFAGGTLACSPACTFDTSACTGNPCGNGTIDPTEDCDGANLGTDDCTTLGFSSGTLTCATDCTFDTTACVPPTCGDGAADPGETCDGTDLAGQMCSDVGSFTGGTLACNPSCLSFDTSSCTAPPTVPVQRKPINDTYLGSTFVPGSLRPTFEWEPSTATGPGTIDYELQYGTDSTFATATFAGTTSTTHTPAADLPVSMTAPVGTRFFWRVRACVASDCSAYSPTWRVNVGRSAHDFNGDGFGDIVAGAYLFGGGDQGRAYVYFGGATLNTVADGTLVDAAAGDGYGYSVAAAGDVNGDGFGDVVVGAPFSDAGGVDAGRAYIYFGGAGTTFEPTADAALDSAAAGDWFGVSVAGAGDLNGDGFGDVVVGAMYNTDGGTDAGAAYVYFGSAGTFNDIADGTLIGTASSELGLSVSSGGDMNGDGFSDVIAGASAEDTVTSNAGAAYVFFGNQGLTLDTTADGTLFGDESNDSFTSSLASAGDVNGDGFDDLVIGARLRNANGLDSGRAWVYLGGAGGSFDPTADGTLDGAAAGDLLGTSVAAADVNGDGFADVVCGAPHNDVGMPVGDNRGAAFVFFGATGASFDATADATLAGEASGDEFGYSVGP